MLRKSKQTMHKIPRMFFSLGRKSTVSFTLKFVLFLARISLNKLTNLKLTAHFISFITLHFPSEKFCNLIINLKSLMNVNVLQNELCFARHLIRNDKVVKWNKIDKETVCHRFAHRFWQWCCVMSGNSFDGKAVENRYILL